MDDKNRQKAIELALASIEKEYGKGAIMRLKDGEHARATTSRSSRPARIGLDIALGIGGYPRGRIVEIYGPESSGKTTLTLHAIAEAQKRRRHRARSSTPSTRSTPTYARKLGVKTDELLVSQPDYGEQALEIADMLVRSGAVDIIVVDSVAALVPKAEIEGEMGDSHVGLQARLMSQALRKLTGDGRALERLLVFINQIRMKIGVMFGRPETTTGGNALKFYASMRLDIRRIGAIKEAASDKKDPVVGNRTRVKVVKNKMAPPFREVEFDILYGQGICRAGDILDLASELGIVEKSGAWFSFEGERIGQGRENAKAYLEEHPELMERLEGQILAKHGIKRAARGAIAGATEEARPRKAPKAEAKPAEIAPDGKPVVRIGAPAAAAPKNGATADDSAKSARPASKPAN